MSPSQEQSRSTFRAVAIDFDGTLASEGRAPDPSVLDALARARSNGLIVILVTGRILSELEETWPQVTTQVDCVVAENGAVLDTTWWHRVITPAVDSRLDSALSSAGVRFRRGETLLACSVLDEAEILGHVRALQLDCQTVANRGELMVVPAGVSKGSGLHHALGQLGLSFHNTVAVGDAENDLSLFKQSELAVAVANAVEPVKAAADLVTDAEDGQGVASLLDSNLFSGPSTARSSRWQLHLGVTEQGEQAVLPASQANILVVGATGTGKSYLAGLLAEQLVQDSYSVLVIDPEGDHAGLARLSGALLVGGGLRLPDPDEVLRLLHHRYSSVVVDLSSLEPVDSIDYQQRLLALAEAHRRATGLPHWVFVDEADRMTSGGCSKPLVLEMAMRGYCLITWRPQNLPIRTIAAIDAVVALDPSHLSRSMVDVAAEVGGLEHEDLAHLLRDSARTALVTRRGSPSGSQLFMVAGRVTPQLRHRHKYDLRPLDRQHSFHFRRSIWELTKVSAGNLGELEEELAHCEGAVLVHHCPLHDFSRWVAEVFHDDSLAEHLAAIESKLSRESDAVEVEQIRLDLIGALQLRLMA